MTNRHADRLLIIARGFLAEALALDKSLARSLERDSIKLEALSHEHGISLFTIILPELAKGLDLALDRGFLPRLTCRLAATRSSRTNIPKLFSGIWSKVFTSSGVLKSVEDLDPTFVLILKNLLVLGKKVELSLPSKRKKTELTCSPAAVYSTIAEFYHVDAQLPVPQDNIWGADVLAFSHSDIGCISDLCRDDLGRIGSSFSQGEAFRPFATLVQQIADRVVSSTIDREIRPMELRLKHGPGATAEFRRGTGYKYLFPTWSSRLEQVFPFDELGLANSNAHTWQTSSQELSFFESDIPSRLCCVPKDGRGPRLIAAEPTANQWIQQGLANFLVSCIDRRPDSIGSCITFHKQYNSAIMARSASLRGTLATVDLKAASDRLSCWLVQRLFRANSSLLRALSASRTRYVSNDVDKKLPSVSKLNKFATMGSALTFPLQSISFFILAIASVCFTRGYKPWEWEKACSGVQVYGDDIVIPVDSLECLRELLHAVGLKINVNKTFSGSNFRESCGTEAFRGYDVTPVKPKKIFNSDGTVDEIACVDSASLLHERGMWHAAKAVRSLVRVVSPVLMTRIGGGVWGDKSFVRPTRSLFTAAFRRKTRWNQDLHYYETLSLMPKAREKSSHRSEGYSNLLQFFTEDPSSRILTTWESGTVKITEAVLARRWVNLEEVITSSGLGGF